MLLIERCKMNFLLTAFFIYSSSRLFKFYTYNVKKLDIDNTILHNKHKGIILE